MLCISCTPDTDNVISRKETEIADVDTVVVCTDERADDALYYAIKDRMPEVYLVGQALSPRRLLDSIADAYVAGRMI